MYEYEFENVPVSQEQFEMIQMQLVDMDVINEAIKGLLNKRAEDGWEPLYPFSVPQIWFRKPKTS